MVVTMSFCMFACCGCASNKNDSDTSSQKKEVTDTKDVKTEDTKTEDTKTEDSKAEDSKAEDLETSLVGYQNIDPDEADILIKKYPQDYTCFKITTSKGVVIITDPYYMDEEVKADIVTESHDHSDHADTSCILGDYKLITSTGEYNEKGIDILGIAGLHDKVQGDPNEIDTSTLYKNNIYIFDIDGIRIAQFGSQGNYPSDDMFKQMGTVDILIMQIFDGGNKMTQAECRNVVVKLQPKILIPGHCGDSFAKVLSNTMGMPCIYPNDVEIGVTRDSLDSMRQTMIVLNN